MHNIVRVEVGDVERGEVLNEVGGEQILRHADEHRAAEDLHEQHDRSANGHVGELEDGLRSDAALLEAQTHAKAVEELEARPGALRAVDFEEGEEPGADAHDDAAGDEEGGEVAVVSHEAAGEDDGEDLCEDEGEGVDARADGAGAFDGLEPYGDEIHVNEEGAADAEAEEDGGGDGALGGDAGGHGGVVLEVDLQPDEDDDGEAEEDEEGDDAAVGPFVDDAAPLQGEQEADDGGHEDGGAERVEVLEGDPEGLLLALRLLLELEEEEEADGCYGADCCGRLVFFGQGGFTGGGTNEG